MAVDRGNQRESLNVLACSVRRWGGCICRRYLQLQSAKGEQKAAQNRNIPLQTRVAACQVWAGPQRDKLLPVLLRYLSWQRCTATVPFCHSTTAWGNWGAGPHSAGGRRKQWIRGKMKNCTALWKLGKSAASLV